MTSGVARSGTMPGHTMGSENRGVLREPHKQVGGVLGHAPPGNFFIFRSSKVGPEAISSRLASLNREYFRPKTSVRIRACSIGGGKIVNSEVKRA